ncbi:ABC transporter substrate-binding protein [Acaryochloris marina]|uniref:Iron ABC transporter, periplasmic iron-binding protein, putative n=1 Tax=Acaryochloris marina (strain MBIC 11017) TaxID=329726 RepID=B0C063_ACAM1|nr:ABC transporter substrate-binding protein [Acaryochloris marina]ABW28410.1 iron ABC transporter, periplasmic iron-binding protein, putative [Acaryochloris marina MBIC11017]
MTNRSKLLLAALLLSSQLFACSNPQPSANSDQPLTADATTNESVKVVALTSLTADIIHHLDDTKLVGIPGSRLIGTDQRFQDLPQVSQGRTAPDLEKIVALKPTLVIGARGFHDQPLSKVEDLGIATLTTEVKGWQDLITLTEEIADQIGADPASLLARYQKCLNKLPSESASTLVLVSRQPILAPNKNSWAGDLLQQFKAKNLAADLQGQSPVEGYVTLSAEKVLEADPDIVLVVDPEQDPVAAFEAEPFWSKLKATQNKRVHAFDYYGLVNPGSISKIEAACTQLQEILQ